jgi:glycosyltransferase involved in cell wall biosynthesis
MKIALFNQPIGTISLPWTVQGTSIEIWIYEIARRLARSCDVIVYSKRGRYQKKVEYDQGVHYRRISATADDWFTYISYAFDKLGRRFPEFRSIRHILFFRNVKRPFFASNLYYLAYALQVARDLRKEKCDIVHIHNFSQFVPIIRAFNPKIKIVLHMHCEWLTQLDRAMIERRLREVDLIIGCCEYITEKIRHGFPQLAKRCQTVYNGVDVNYFIGKNARHGATKKNGDKRLLSVGRASPEKGLHILLDAFQKVVECCPRAQLEIVGPQVSAPIEFIVALSDDDKISDLASFYDGNSSSSYFSHLQEQLHSLNIANNVTFAGFIPYGHVTNNYRDVDVFVNSSFSEGFPLPILEAMASELPVVATLVGGIAEAVENGKTGLLVESGDATVLAEAILHLLSDEDLRKSMGKAARKRAVERFSWEKIVENLLCQYKKICDVHE